jgi:hypothetical protein
LQDDLLKLNEALTNSRLDAHAQRINTMEYPAYEGLMNSYVARHQFLISRYQGQWRDIEAAHAQTYCDYLKKIDLNAHCTVEDRLDETRASLYEIKVDGCHFTPLKPTHYYR